jgi:hypothetical protein
MDNTGRRQRAGLSADVKREGGHLEVTRKSGGGGGAGGERGWNGGLGSDRVTAARRQYDLG